jgi:hypothetical protein
LGALENILGEHFIPFTKNWQSQTSLVGYQSRQFDLSSVLEAKSPTEMFNATLTYFSDPRLQGYRLS